MRNQWLGAACLVAIALAGCNKGSSDGQGTGASLPGPEKSVAAFLTAVSQGNEEQIFAMLTEDARKGLKEQGITPQLPAGGTTSFEVGQVEYVEGGAHVASKWIEKLEDGNQTTEVLWMLRKEPVGWRVAGMAMKVFEDLEAVIINLEDPADMIAKQQLIAEEEERREQAAEQAATQPTTQAAARSTGDATR